MTLSKQKGFLSIVALMIIILTGLVGTVVAYLFVSNAASSNLFLQGEQALYLAEGGLEKATQLLLTPTLSARVSCAGLSGNANITNSTLGNGTFTVTPVAGSPFYTNSTLSSNISSTSTTLTLANASTFASSGRIAIDNENIGYSAKSGNQLLALVRGMDNTLPTQHVANSRVSQYLCLLSSQAGIPTLTSPAYKRSVQQAVQLQEAWAAGAASGSSFSFIRWNQPTELQWTNSPIVDATNKVNLNGMSILSNVDGWAVGNVKSISGVIRFIVLRLSSTGWGVFPLPVGVNACSGQNLLSVSSVSVTEAWAVGIKYRVNCAGAVFRYTVLRWNGSNWDKLIPPNIPADGTSTQIQDLNAVHVIDTVGNGTGTAGVAVGLNGTALIYNGIQWLSNPIAGGINYYGAFTVSATEIWAVGNNGRLAKWNGTAWTVTTPASVRLNAIAMMDTNGDGQADIGWAVGNSGTAIRYSAGTWTTQDIGGNVTYTSVTIMAPDDVWAVGTGGNIKHWDGTTWLSVTSPTSVRLNAISSRTAKMKPVSSWREIYP